MAFNNWPKFGDNKNNTASGSGHVTTGGGGNGWGAIPNNPNIANDLFNFFNNIAGNANNYGDPNASSGRGRGGGGGGGGGGSALQQIDPLDLQAWDAQLALQNRGYNQAKTFLPQAWQDTLAKLRNSTKTAGANYKDLVQGLNLNRGTAKRTANEQIRDFGQARDENLYNLFSDATARGAITAQGTQQNESIIGREYGEGVGTTNANLLDQLKGYALNQKTGRRNLDEQLADIHLARRGATRQHLQDKLSLDAMANQVYFDTAARGQVQNQIGGQPIPYINVPGSAGQVIHFGGIGTKF